MTETNPSFPELPLLSPGIQELIPEGWTPPPIPEDSSLDPVTYRTVEVWATFAGKNMLWSSQRRMGDMMLAEDLVQDTFLSFIQTYKRDATKNGHGKLLHTILRRRIADFYQTKGRRPEELRDFYDSEDFLDEMGDPQQHIAEAQLLTDIQRLAKRARLTEVESRLFGFAMLEYQTANHLSAQELAEIFHTSDGSIRVSQHRMRKKVGEAMDQKYPDAEISLSRPVKSAKPPEKEKPVSVKQLRDGVLRNIKAARGEQATTLTAVLPTYLSPWHIVASDMHSVLSESVDAKAQGLIIYPHEQYAGMLGRHLGTVAGRTVCSLDEALHKDHHNGAIIVDTPENVALNPDVTELPIEYVAHVYTDGQDMIPGNFKDGRPAFVLAISDGCGQLPVDTYYAPSYSQAGGRKIRWETDDSRNYVAEWQLRYGRPLTETDISDSDSIGKGPGLRRLCRGIGSFAAVQVRAGVEPTAPPPVKRFSR